MFLCFAQLPALFQPRSRKALDSLLIAATTACTSHRADGSSTCPFGIRRIHQSKSTYRDPASRPGLAGRWARTCRRGNRTCPEGVVGATTVAKHLHQCHARGCGQAMNQCSFSDGAGEMRNQADVMCFGQRDNLHVFGDATSVGQLAAHVIHQFLFDQGINIPFVAELFAHRDGHAHAITQPFIRIGAFTAQEILAEIRMQGFDESGQVYGIRHVEFRMKIQSPVTVTHGTVYFQSIFVHLPNQFETVDDTLARVVGGMAVNADTGINAGLGTVAKRSVEATPGKAVE